MGYSFWRFLSMLILLYVLNVLSIRSLILWMRRCWRMLTCIHIDFLELLLVSMSSSSPFVVTSWSRLCPSILHFWLSLAQAQAVKSIISHLFLERRPRHYLFNHSSSGACWRRLRFLLLFDGWLRFL